VPPKSNLATYTFGPMTIQHHYCSACGIHPFSEGMDPSGQPMAAINVRCLEDFDFAASRSSTSMVALCSRGMIILYRLFGRRTYEGKAAYCSEARGGIADFMNGVEKLVASRTL
jgi:hypothetical protein